MPERIKALDFISSSDFKSAVVSNYKNFSELKPHSYQPVGNNSHPVVNQRASTFGNETSSNDLQPRWNASSQRRWTYTLVSSD